MRLTKDQLQTILMALTRVEILEERLLKKRNNEHNDEFLHKCIETKLIIQEMLEENQK